MPAADLQALVVDDEPLVRQLTARALRSEGFSCDIAGDGAEALRKIDEGQYDVVVTDLCMPNQHGHALASSLVRRRQRPLVIVLTALCEPRMTKDLLTRGVDDVMYKPVDYPAFAAKIRGLVNRKASEADSLASAPVSAERRGDVRLRPAASFTPAAISPGEFQRSLDQVSRLAPISSATLQILKLTQASACTAEHLATAARPEAALVIEILRLANSAFFSPAGGKIVDLEQAVARIGQRRVCELALSVHAFGLFNSSGVPWLNREATWRRCRAAGVAVDLLAAQAGHAAHNAGLFLPAIMHGLGRVMLGLLFPRQYETLTAACRRDRQLLSVYEARIFPLGQAVVMAQLLEGWGVPAEVFQPLRYLEDDFATVARLPDPLRAKVELVKLAVLLGELAVAVWDPWDPIEIPREAVLKRLHIADPAGISQGIRDVMQAGPTAGSETASGPPIPSIRASANLRYASISPAKFDFLAELLAASGACIRHVVNLSDLAAEPTVVNCLGVAPEIVNGLFLKQSAPLTLVTDACSPKQIRGPATCLRLPTSFAALTDTCVAASRN